jgi:hypothetical protein
VVGATLDFGPGAGPNFSGGIEPRSRRKLRDWPRRGELRWRAHIEGVGLNRTDGARKYFDKRPNITLEIAQMVFACATIFQVNQILLEDHGVVHSVLHALPVIVVAINRLLKRPAFQPLLQLDMFAAELIDFQTKGPCGSLRLHKQPTIPFTQELSSGAIFVQPDRGFLGERLGLLERAVPGRLAQAAFVVRNNEW